MNKKEVDNAMRGNTVYQTFLYFFFYLGFPLFDTHKSQDSRGKERPIFPSL